mmetsp:Transcript_64977/g.120982  ORF Transcript_64977/g.120982 Transcript_64977/m.120982 type:complete len:373 (-) Transcript_64977:77-1195(-)
MQGGLGATGQQHAEDCTFPAGKVAGAPLVVSWFIVIFTVYQILEAVKPGSQFPTWMMVLRVVGNQFILYSSVLVHELGHGSMAKYLGGSIWKILLWPFGGICFSHHPETDDARTSLKNNLKIVVAGPATHFPQTTVWILFLLGFEACVEVFRETHIAQMLLPFQQPRAWFPRNGGLWAQLLYGWILWGIQINVMSFFFNVFFPMYPMDCAKILVCSLQLCCKVSARTAALVLICCAIPCAVLLLGAAAWAWWHAGPMAAISGYIGVMAIADALKIWRLRNERRLHLHPLFMNARSNTINASDEFGSTRRLNTADLDDEPPSAEMSTRRVQNTPLQPFAGSGYVLGTGNHAGKDSSRLLVDASKPGEGAAAGS